MKKLMMLLAIASLSTAAVAQEWTAESIPTSKHRIVTNGFWDNWFIDLGADHLSFYSNQEHGLGMNKNPFWTGRRSWGLDLSVGKWATPVFGMRVKGQANWGTIVTDGVDATYQRTINQFSVSVQPMVSLVNLFAGYKPGRIYNGSLYAGFGMIENTTTSNCSMLMDLGYLSTFNITKRFHINLDLYVRASEDDMDGYTKGGFSPRVFKTRDLQFGVSAGIGVNLGKVDWDNAPDVDAIVANHNAQVAALNGTIAGLESENADLRNKLRNQKPAETKTVTEFKSTSASVFFDINSSEIASKKDLVNVKELAEYAKQNNKKVVVTGYADSQTGSADYNQTLSEARAQAVADALVEMGVSRDNIETSGQGGVADLDPYQYNRRAVVTLK